MFASNRVRIMVATEPVDFRNYAAPIIMCSRRRRWTHWPTLRHPSTPHNYALSRGKHRDQFIRRAEFAWLDAERRQSVGHLEFFGRVGAQIDLRALESDVTQPQRYFANVARRLKHVHGCCGRSLGIMGEIWIKAVSIRSGDRLAMRRKPERTFQAAARTPLTRMSWNREIAASPQRYISSAVNHSRRSAFVQPSPSRDTVHLRNALRMTRNRLIDKLALLYRVF